MLAKLAAMSALVSLSLGCSVAGPTAEGAGATEDAIIGGTVDKKDEAVVELVMASGDDEGTCTATFIPPNVLLTAAHCAVDDDTTVIPKNAIFTVVLAPSRASATKSQLISVPRANVHVHPGYDGDATHDVAVVVLDEAVILTPMTLHRTPITKADIGKQVRIVGYGQAQRKSSAHDGSETKRSVTTTIRGLEDDLVKIGKTGQQACDGDSGGPAFITVDGEEQLLATDDLAATDTNCAGGDLYQRVDLQQGWIDTFL